MMSTETPMERPTDSELHAYLDGELDQADVTALEGWLAGHPEDAAKVHAFKLQKIQMHQLYDAHLDAAVPDSVTELFKDPEPRQWLPGWRQIAAGIALLIIGGATGWGVTQYGDGGANQARGNQFVRRALDAHVVYAHDTNQPVELRSTEQKRLINWLSDRLGHKLMTPDLAGKGFHLIGGRLVNDQNMPAALFMYEDKVGKRVTLYVRPGMVGGNTKFRFIAEHGMVAFYWTNGPLTYALTGEMPRNALLMLAQMIHDDISAASS